MLVLALALVLVLVLVLELMLVRQHLALMGRRQRQPWTPQLKGPPLPGAVRSVKARVAVPGLVAVMTTMTSSRLMRHKPDYSTFVSPHAARSKSPSLIDTQPRRDTNNSANKSSPVLAGTPRTTGMQSRYFSINSAISPSTIDTNSLCWAVSSMGTSLAWRSSTSTSIHGSASRRATLRATNFKGEHSVHGRLPQRPCKETNEQPHAANNLPSQHDQCPRSHGKECKRTKAVAAEILQCCQLQ